MISNVRDSLDNPDGFSPVKEKEAGSPASPKKSSKSPKNARLNTTQESKNEVTSKYGLHQAQKFSVNKRIKQWNYQPMATEFTEEMLLMSGGNIYHQGTYN